MKEIAIYDKNNEVIKVSLRELASWTDSKILTTTPFDENVNLMQLVDEYRMKARTIECPINAHLDHVINILKQLQQQDAADYKIKFNGEWLFSININEVEAYRKVTGMTPEELTNQIQKERKRIKIHQEQEKNDALTNKQRRIDAGKKQIIEAKWDEWENFVEKLSRPPYYVHALNTVIKYLELLNNASLSVNAIANLFYKEFQNDCGDWYSATILTNIAKYSERGTQLFREVANIHKEQGNKVFNNNKALKQIDDINKLIAYNVPYEDAKILVKSDIYDVRLGDILTFKVINIDENLYEGISNTGKYTIIARIGEYFVTYLFSNDKYTRYIRHCCKPEMQIATSEKPIVKIEECVITGLKMNNRMKNKANIYTSTSEARENVNIGLILQAYKEINDFAKTIDIGNTNTQVIDCIVDINNRKILKKI